MLYSVKLGINKTLAEQYPARKKRRYGDDVSTALEQHLLCRVKSNCRVNGGQSQLKERGGNSMSKRDV